MPEQEQQPPSAAAQPEKMLDMERVRYWAGRGISSARPRGARPAYSLGALDDDCPWSCF
jgi:hypothetical protein